MKAAKTVSASIVVCIVMPIWYYLIYWLLRRAGAGELQLFLFWVYLPAGVFVRILDKLVELDGKSP
jgi:hypothetical protein